jgi:hypothetical protein
VKRFLSTRMLVAAGAIYALAAFLGGGGDDAPSLGASAEAIARYAAGHGGVGGAAYVEELALVALLVFAAAVAARIRRGDHSSPLPSLVTSGAILTVVVKFASFAPAFALYSHQRPIQPDVARALFEMNGFAFVISWFGQALLLLAVCAAGASQRSLPLWIAATAGVIGAGLLVDAGLAIGGRAVPAVELLWLAWVLAASIALTVEAWRARQAPDASLAPAGQV